MEKQQNSQATEADDQKPVTKKVLVETLREFRKDVQQDIHAAIDERVPKIIDERVPLILGQFTEEVLLPSIVTMIREELAKSEHRMKVYIDSKIAAINGDRELFRKFMVKTVDLLRRHRLGTESEIDDLRRLIPQQ